MFDWFMTNWIPLSLGLVAFYLVISLIENIVQNRRRKRAEKNSEVANVSEPVSE